jgi:predicted MFS family arabinose efflux permease
MDRITAITATIALFSWGIGSFIGKIATNRIGEKAVFWDILGYVPGVIIYCLFALMPFLYLKVIKPECF